MHVARVMIHAGRDSIINITSVASTFGGDTSYTSSNHGVLGLMRNAEMELGQYGIQVNCVSPYMVAYDEVTRNMFKMLRVANLKRRDSRARGCGSSGTWQVMSPSV
ncbi:hypothetical protein SLA2020_045020 [Shorea laevis]